MGDHCLVWTWQAQGSVSILHLSLTPTQDLYHFVKKNRFTGAISQKIPIAIKNMLLYKLVQLGPCPLKMSFSLIEQDSKKQALQPKICMPNMMLA